MEKKLELNLNVKYGGMCRDMNRLVAIMASKNSLPWYINNFIPQVMYDTGNIHCYDTNYSYEIFEIYDQIANFEFIKMEDNKVENLIKAIDNDEYILLNCDKYFIKGSNNYMTNHLFQEFLIYGYNTDKKIFYYFSILNNSKGYNVGEITFGELLESISETLNNINEREALNWQYAFTHPFSKFSVKKNENHINLRKMFYLFYTQFKGNKLTFSFQDNSEKEYYTGIMIFDGIHKVLKSLENDKNNLTSEDTVIWSIKLLAEHTKSHAMRFEYLFNNKIITMNEEIVPMINDISNRIIILYNILKKYLVFGKERDIQKCYNLIDILKNDYTNMLKLAIELIQNEIENKIR